MADVTTSTLLENGPRNWSYRLTNFSDGTGETGITKVDGSASGPLGVAIAGQTLYPGVHIKITEIRFQLTDMSLRIQWDASVATDAWFLTAGADTNNFKRVGGIFIPVGLAGATGKILFTTVGQQVNSSYAIVMYGTKGIHQ